jgi:UDP-N-acetylmuramoyl-L-alanyl-D-glutamate--2,6-diaminopimelate ligase
VAEFLDKILSKITMWKKEKSVNLRELITDIDVEKIAGNPDLEIEGVAYDSRKIQPNFLFVAISGFKEDGHHFIGEAIERGARAVIIEKEIQIPFPKKIVSVRVPSSRLALAQISNRFYDFPTGQIRVIGITGTNGKTTTAYLIESILRRCGFRVGKISTIDYTLGRGFSFSSITTPESEDAQRMIRAMVDDHLDYVVMEVSSHALVLHRIEGVEFDWAVFTNFSPEHLDFHKNLDEYLNAKISLFKSLSKLPKKKSPKGAIVNADDPVASYIMGETPCQIITYGIKKEAAIRGKVLEVSGNGVSFVLEADSIDKINLHLLGIHNVYNALAAASVALGEKIPFALIKAGLESLRRVPGRLELVENSQGFRVFVDYAHTADGLEKVLQTLREVVQGRLLVVFGCGGDRDRQKRPLMGKIALKLADYSIITSDNPRSEDPEEIVDQIEKGVKEAGAKRERDYLVIVDRREAIKEALEKMKKEDTLLIAGKGHERFQIFKDRAVEFEDRKVVQDLLGRG